MERLVGLRVVQFGGIEKADLADLAHVNILVGPTGAGKTSLLQAVEYSLTGEVVTPLARLTLAELRRGDDAVVESHWSGGLNVMRHLGPKAQSLFINGESSKRLADAEQKLYQLLGTDKDTLALLCRTHSFLSMKPLDQLQTLLGFGEGEQAAREDMLAALEDDQRAVAEGLNLVSDLSVGQQMIESALGAAEAKRTEGSRLKKNAQTAYDQAEEALKAALNREEIGFRDIDDRITRATQAVANANANLDRLVAAGAEYVKQQQAHEAAWEAVKEANLAVEEARGRRVEAEMEYDPDAYQTALKRAQEATHSAERAEQVHKGLWETLARLQGKRELLGDPEDLVAEEPCPTCRRPITQQSVDQMRVDITMLDKQIAEVSDKESAQAQTVRNKCSVGRELVATAESLAPPNFEALDAEINRLVARADSLEAKREGIQEGFTAIPQPNDEELAKLNETAQAAENLLATYNKLDELREEWTYAKSAKLDAEAAWANLDAIVKRWRKWVQERGGEEGQGLADELAALSPSLPLLLDADGLWSPRATGLEETNLALHRLSTGERTLVGAAIQTVFATKTGVGVVLVDDASVWDDARASAWLEQAAEIAREQDVTLLLATTHWSGAVPDGARLISVLDGEVVDG